MVASLLRGLSGVSAGGGVPPLGTACASSVGTSVDGEFVAERRPPLPLPATSAVTRTTLPDAVIILPVAKKSRRGPLRPQPADASRTSRTSPPRPPRDRRGHPPVAGYPVRLRGGGVRQGRRGRSWRRRGGGGGAGHLGRYVSDVTTGSTAGKNAADAAELGDVVAWIPHGRAFQVHQPKVFAVDIPPRFFTRQLKRITRGQDAGAYYHELFLRGRPRLALRMRRQKIKGTGIKLTPNPESRASRTSTP
mmetsp:Transcript_2576/g.4400  ORF Transcript_2576/g.4400 Transcript_2576/m.4400 type:complete len:249 (-) Transcript_2576:287-1033(-)